LVVIYNLYIYHIMGKNNRKYDPNAEYILYFDKKSGKHIRCNMWTPLMWKIKYKKHFTLTDADIRDINKVNSVGISALVLAVIHSDNLYSVAKIKMLIDAGASINTRYRCLNAEDKFNVLWFAVRSYINNISEDNSDLNSNSNIIKLLIQENAGDNYDGYYNNPQSSLLCAFKDKLDESIINLLLNIKNLNVNTKTTKGNTVLHYAIYKQYSYDK
jgi:ankyrin repeat protein